MSPTATIINITGLIVGCGLLAIGCIIYMYTDQTQLRNIINAGFVTTLGTILIMFIAATTT